MVLFVTVKMISNWLQIWPRFLMYFCQMALQVATLGKSSCTKLTSKWSFSCMISHVNFKLGTTIEAFATHCAIYVEARFADSAATALERYRSNIGLRPIKSIDFFDANKCPFLYICMVKMVECTIDIVKKIAHLNPCHI